jgi:hypothetical protein
MMERYAIAAARIRKELVNVEQVIERAERALASIDQNSQDSDLYLDSAALNLHNFYAGMERIFRQIAASVDQTVPTGPEWHRELLQQMNVSIAPTRPQVLSDDTMKAIDEYLRFRHVVQNVYAFEFDPVRIGQLVKQLRPTFDQVRAELLAFADFLDSLAGGEPS